MNELASRESGGEFLLYYTDDGQLKLEVRLEDETVWLTQQMIAELFQTTVPNISTHIRNIYEEGELTPEATVKEFLTVRREGKREVRRELDFYNLDMIISVGYRHDRRRTGSIARQSSAPQYGPHQLEGVRSTQN